MTEKFLKKIIAQNQEDLRVISALCSGSKIKQSEIKFLRDNKIFLMSIERENKEEINSQKVIKSILKFEYIQDSKSKNINQKDDENILELLAIDLFRKEKNYEIVLLFSNNGIINLNAEVIEVELDNIEKTNDKN